MSPDQAVAFALFSLVMAATPGPSNTLLTATGAQVGLLRGLPAVLGVCVAMGGLMFGVTLGLGSLIAGAPLVLDAMRWAGAAVLLWFAYQIARSSAHAGSPATPRPVGFAGAAAFQLVNPKSWLACASAAAAFGTSSMGTSTAFGTSTMVTSTASGNAESLVRAATLAAIFVAVALPSCAVWLSGGALLQRALHSPRAQRTFNLAMAALLVLSVVLLFFV
jgi:threonine/homoserine/homoserine lactone efflux protein